MKSVFIINKIKLNFVNINDEGKNILIIYYSSNAIKSCPPVQGGYKKATAK